ncbi:FAD-dependent monooxygenase [Vannielia litorea]|uniref:FAD-dependent monooxygenase n=1 Tax=Vannielia litorea TaxID=1217970 RepID=UPI001FD32B5D|nr:FAD-dependent monooxygenase [Vannielia litorea]MBS8226465.1 monooxygenase [Vannielia litorea]
MAELSSIDIVGGGPGGLTAAILAARAFPAARITVHEAAPRGVTWGFGVVFSDRALDFLKADDPETHDLIAPRMERWQNMVLNHPDGAVTLDGIGFAAIGRLELLTILAERAEALGVALHFGAEVDPATLTGDLIIGADGLNSRCRSAANAPSLTHMSNRFAWFGTPRPFYALTQTFLRHPKGALNAHHYRYAPDMSTFIVELEEDAFQAHGFAEMGEEESAATCAELFSEALEGAPLLTNRSIWRQFPKLWCETWATGTMALLGDAVHTAHFSIGSGTRLAMEDAIALIAAVSGASSLEAGLAAYQQSRPPVARKIVTGANTSAEWYESFSRHMEQPPLDFAMSYVTRSGRVPPEKLRALSPAFMAQYEAAQ